MFDASDPKKTTIRDPSNKSRSRAGRRPGTKTRPSEKRSAKRPRPKTKSPAAKRNSVKPSLLHPPPDAASSLKASSLKARRITKKLPFKSVAMLLQGGGALGAYQAGAYEALSESGIEPNWLAGISIGAINAAIIAGNKPQERVAKLRAFWEQVTAPRIASWLEYFDSPLTKGDDTRRVLNQISAGNALSSGVPGFFGLRMPAPWLNPAGTPQATSFYDIGALKSTLDQVIDFDRINADDTRFSVGAVNVRSGNFVYFDNTTRKIRPEHVMASGALPPGFPAVEIEGEHYWDGGMVSNTPLRWVVENGRREDTLIFQVDLWSARGEVPGNMMEVVTRQKEIQYSSRTRANTDWFIIAKRMRCALASLLPKLPNALKNTPEAKLLASVADHSAYNIIHLIYHAQNYEGNSKDYEFSRRSMQEHWCAGYNDAVRTLHHPEVLEKPKGVEGVFTFDLAADGRE